MEWDEKGNHFKPAFATERGFFLSEYNTGVCKAIKATFNRWDWEKHCSKVSRHLHKVLLKSILDLEFWEEKCKYQGITKLSNNDDFIDKIIHIKQTVKCWSTQIIMLFWFVEKFPRSRKPIQFGRYYDLCNPDPEIVPASIGNSKYFFSFTYFQQKKSDNILDYCVSKMMRSRRSNHWFLIPDPSNPTLNLVS